jgi:hypothetical protein
MANLASTYWNQGKWNEAEQLEVQVMDMRKKLLGAEHPDTLTSMANLASTYNVHSSEACGSTKQCHVGFPQFICNTACTSSSTNIHIGIIYTLITST